MRTSSRGLDSGGLLEHVYNLNHKAEYPLTRCRLCSTPAELHESHIFPNFYIKSILAATGSTQSQGPKSMIILDRTAKLAKSVTGSEGADLLLLREPLLCTKCEKHFQRWETWFRKTFYGCDPSPLSKKAMGRLVIGATPGGDRIRFREMAVEYERLKLFVLSLLWRASVASGRHFSAISLGERHESTLAKLLLNDDPGAESFYPIVVAELVGEPITDFFPAPGSAVDEQTRVRHYTITLGGYRFQIYKAKPNRQLPRGTRALMLKATGSVLAFQIDSSEIVDAMATRILQDGISLQPL